MEFHKINIRPITDKERIAIDKCKHEYALADRIWPLAICCVKCGYTLIKNPDGTVKEMYSPAH